MRLLLGLALGLAACGTTIRQIPTNAPPHPLTARPAESVEVFTATQPQRPFVEVAFFEAQQESAVSLDDQSAVFAKLREQAGQAGCDGLIINGPNDSVVGDRHNVNTLRGYAGTCIVYR
jgi:hypothetical protein